MPKKLICRVEYSVYSYPLMYTGIQSIEHALIMGGQILTNLITNLMAHAKLTQLLHNLALDVLFNSVE